MSFSTDIEHYRQAGLDFVVAARGRRESQNQPAEGGWSATMIAHHMADADMHFAIRIREVLVHDKPILSVFDEELYAEKLEYQRRPIEPALLLIKSIREETSDLLIGVPDDAWARTGIRTDGTSFTLSQLVKKSTDHAQEHIEQLRNAL